MHQVEQSVVVFYSFVVEFSDPSFVLKVFDILTTVDKLSNQEP